MMWKFLQIQLQHLLLQASRSSYDILAISTKPCPLFCAVSLIFPHPSQGLFWMPVLQEKPSSVQLPDKQKLKLRSCKDTPSRLCDSQSLSQTGKGPWWVHFGDTDLPLLEGLHPAGVKAQLNWLRHLCFSISDSLWEADFHFITMHILLTQPV